MSTKQPQQSDGQSRKRKRENAPDHRSGHKKRLQDARIISTQTSGKAFGNGELDVDKFVKAREFEIKALEDGMKRAKKALSTRAFQQVPRDLRRRTASHNAKRVPKRLRARAEKEMAEDNTPKVTSKVRKAGSKLRLRMDTAKRLQNLCKKGDENKRKKKRNQTLRPVDGEDAKMEIESAKQEASSKPSAVKTRAPRVKKDTISKLPIPRAKFRKRQIHKAWLPTHLFHTKRAHMTPPSEPLWRMAIPLSPTTKSYRATHRASSSRGAVAWDMSYISTMLLEGKEDSLIALLQALGIGHDESSSFWDKNSSTWIRGSRFWEGWLLEKDVSPMKSIVPATIIWCSKIEGNELYTKKPKSRQIFVRVHPSAFSEAWTKTLTLAKSQNPPVTLQDLRFDIGSIEITGPASTEALFGILRASSSSTESTGVTNKISNIPCELLPLLGTVTNPAVLPRNALFALDIDDPRLRNQMKAQIGPQQDQSHKNLMEALTRWPLDERPASSRLFDRVARLASCRQMPSQKAINRRRSLCAPGAQPTRRATDPQVPVLLMATRSQGNIQGSWTIILPWKYVQPFWYSLMHYPLFMGGTIRFGGLEQKRQLLFETGTAWFPSDYPGTEAGMAWEDRERARRKADWEKRPKGKRVSWNSLDLGHEPKGEIGLGWACDWNLLRRDCHEDQQEGEQQEGVERPLPYQLPRMLAESMLTDVTKSLADVLSQGLASVRLKMLAGGVPTTCARIYRLPHKDRELRSRWLSLYTQKASAPKAKDRTKRPPKDAPAHVRQQYLAANLLDSWKATDQQTASHPKVPDMHDLIGFVTTGNFNLGEGIGTGLGSIFLQKACERYTDASEALPRKELQLCIVRNAGQVTGRLARWEFTHT